MFLAFSFSHFQLDHSEPAGASLRAGPIVKGTCSLQTHSPGPLPKASPHPENARCHDISKSRSRRNNDPGNSRNRLGGSQRADTRLTPQPAWWPTIQTVTPAPARSPGGDRVPSVLHTLVRITSRFHSSCSKRGPLSEDGPS